MPCPWCLSGYGVRAKCQWFGLRPIHMVWTRTRSVHCLLLTSMYRTYHMWHFALTLSEPSICGFALDSHRFSNVGFSRHSVLHFRKKNSVFGFHLSWPSGARKQSVLHQHSTEPLTAFQTHCWARAIQAQVELEESENIWYYPAGRESTKSRKEGVTSTDAKDRVSDR